MFLMVIFFQRYNERCKLLKTNFLDFVKHFFENNAYAEPKFKIANDSIMVISICNYGVMLGEIQPENGWTVFKTFIDRTLVNAEQSEIEKLIIRELDVELNSTHPIEKGIEDHDIPFKKEFLKKLSEKNQIP